MKKYLISLLLVSLYFVASAGKSASLRATLYNEVVGSANKLPHEDLEYSIHGGLSSNYINHVAKRIAGDIPVLENSWAGSSTPYSSIHITASTLYSKRYLLHIHPSHHFW